MDKRFNFWMMEEIAKDFQVNALNSSTSDCDCDCVNCECWDCNCGYDCDCGNCDWG